jgi:large subunit ribosomal protein L7Ae
MSKPYTAPDKLKEKSLEFLTKVVDNGGKIKKGMNETTKCIERQKAKFIAIASDVDPPEIVYHIPILCDEKKVPYIMIDTKEALGKSVKLQVPCSAVAVIDVPKNLSDDLKNIQKDIDELKK